VGEEEMVTADEVPPVEKSVCFIATGQSTPSGQRF
jgi:hypothetical protein